MSTLGQFINFPIEATGALAALNTTVVVDTQGFDTAVFSFNIGTLATTTVLIEVSHDNSTWITANLINLVTGAISASVTAAAGQVLQSVVTGVRYHRIRVSTAGTGTGNAFGKAINNPSVQNIIAGTGTLDLAKAEDSPHTTADVGIMALAVRQDVAAAQAANGDYVPIPVSGSGHLWVTGQVAHDSPTVGHPLRIGGKSSAAAPADVSLDGDQTDIWVLRNGAQATVLTAAGALIGGDATNGLDVDVTRVTGTVTTAESQVLTDNGGFTDGTSKVFTAGYIYDEVAGTAVSENDVAAARINLNRAQVGIIEDGVTRGRWATVSASNALKIDGSGVTQPVSIAAAVTVSQATASSLNAQVVGAAASGAAKAGNPVQVGGVFNTTQPTVTTGQAVEAQSTARGALIVATGVDSLTVATHAVTQSGTWIVSANSGVDIGDVTINNAAGASGVNIQDGGNSITVDSPVGTPTFVRLSDGAAAITNLATNIAQVNGGTVTTVATGTQKVGISDSAGTAFLSAANALNSTGGGVQAVQLVGQFDDATPTAITENQFGNIRMSANRNLFGTIRDAAGNERGANVTASNALVVDASGTTLTVNAHAVTQATASSLKAQVQGEAASGATKAGNPVQVGAVFNTTQPTVTSGQAVENQATARGALIVATGVDSLTVATHAVTQSGTWVSTGAAADGAAVSGNPVLIAGQDGTNTQTLLTDTSGRQVVIGAAADGAAVTGNPILMGGQDGTNAQSILTDTTGRQITVGAAADGAAVAGNPILMGGQDGTNAQSILTDTGGRQIVKEVRSATPSFASVAASATTVTVLATNANRLGATIYNDSTVALYLKLGATASTTSFTVKMVADGYYEVPFAYTGVIDGIWASATGNARVTELTV